MPIENAIYFESATQLREWFSDHAATEKELWVGFYKIKARPNAMTYLEAVDEALCVGWIDGLKKGVDTERYAQRFTPRKPDSTWSRVNSARVAELIALDRMTEAGHKAFAQRREDRVGIYSFENPPAEMTAEFESMFRQSATGWDFFSAQPPGYKRTATWWVMSAKREETRFRRLQQLIEVSERRLRLAILSGQSNKLIE